MSDQGYSLFDTLYQAADTKNKHKICSKTLKISDKLIHHEKDYVFVTLLVHSIHISLNNNSQSH